ncbi:hypothetical protein FA10DRAFT_260347 [Acaromyces ingoldii]|uniref:Uncharacterized protein n=1 Tax=Acaromyces ingoldii TaxID=215250 RepID=A0A316YMC9_9BASI|nr:hypothetical protein FA10DRAFT_260347 [Acaromyces ingoldii]PWN90527.1 hypothetical protein FA10DRAFT_260347 [Acaromyces ingoldii]
MLPLHLSVSLVLTTTLLAIVAIAAPAPLGELHASSSVIDGLQVRSFAAHGKAGAIARSLKESQANTVDFQPQEGVFTKRHEADAGHEKRDEDDENEHNNKIDVDSSVVNEHVLTKREKTTPQSCKRQCTKEDLEKWCKSHKATSNRDLKGE